MLLLYYGRMVIWLTGLSGAGKTTLAHDIRDILTTRHRQVALVDDDACFARQDDDHGPSESAWFNHTEKVQALAKELADQGNWVLVTSIYNHPDLLDWNRAHIPSYFEVLVDVPLELARKRDPHGLYADFAAGRINHLIGLDIPFHRPAQPDLVLDAAREEPPEQGVLRIITAVPGLGGPIRNAAA